MTCGGSRPSWVKGKAVAVGRDSDSTQRFRRGSGVGMPGRGDRIETREALAVAARDRQPDSGDGLAWAVWGDGEARSSDEAG
jgi:hypothetical protein